MMIAYRIILIIAVGDKSDIHCRCILDIISMNENWYVIIHPLPIEATTYLDVNPGFINPKNGFIYEYQSRVSYEITGGSCYTMLYPMFPLLFPPWQWRTAHVIWCDLRGLVNRVRLRTKITIEILDLSKKDLGIFLEHNITFVSSKKNGDFPDFFLEVYPSGCISDLLLDIPKTLGEGLGYLSPFYKSLLVEIHSLKCCDWTMNPLDPLGYSLWGLQWWQFLGTLWYPPVLRQKPRLILPTVVSKKRKSVLYLEWSPHCHIILKILPGIWFWHSIWKSIWHVFWHSSWHRVRHSLWHRIFWCMAHIRSWRSLGIESESADRDDGDVLNHVNLGLVNQGLSIGGTPQRSWYSDTLMVPPQRNGPLGGYWSRFDIYTIDHWRFI